MFSGETDPILFLIKRIMHSEGDTKDLSTLGAKYLKDSLQVLSHFFKEEKQEEEKKEQHGLYDLNMPLLTYVFEESVKRFYSHKALKRITK
jgi:hypothetical protein